MSAVALVPESVLLGSRALFWLLAASLMLLIAALLWIHVLLRDRASFFALSGVLLATTGALLQHASPLALGVLLSPHAVTGASLPPTPLAYVGAAFVAVGAFLIALGCVYAALRVHRARGSLEVPERPMRRGAHRARGSAHHEVSSPVLRSILWSSYEVGFVLLPALVWALTLFSLGKTGHDLWGLPAWSFISVSVYGAILRDSLKAFHRHENPRDRQDRELAVILALSGLVLSSILLALSVLKAQGYLPLLWPVFYDFVFLVLSFGVALLFIVKAIMVQRVEFGRY